MGSPADEEGPVSLIVAQYEETYPELYKKYGGKMPYCDEKTTTGSLPLPYPLLKTDRIFTKSGTDRISCSNLLGKKKVTFEFQKELGRGSAGTVWLAKVVDSPSGRKKK